MDNSPLVSIICITYNHEKFISQAIDGFLSQKTGFPIEIFIHDDCSTDNTVAIIKEYQTKYPEQIKPIYQVVNQYSLGKKITPIVYPLCKGKYIAMCEGDDYWTDPYKLQKQVDFLETHPDFSICFHNAMFLYEDGRKSHSSNPINQKDVSGIEDLIDKNFIPTASCVFRNGNIKKFPDWFFKLPFGDWSIHIMNATYGKIKYINDVMSIYRIHDGGLWSGFWSKKNSVEDFVKNMYLRIQFYDYVDVFLEYKYHELVEQKKILFHDKVVKKLLENNRLNDKSLKKSLHYCIKHGFFNKNFSRKELIKIFLQVHFPSFYSMFSFS